MGHRTFVTFGLLAALLSVVDIAPRAAQIRYSSAVAILASSGVVFIVARYIRRGGSKVLTAIEVLLFLVAVFFSVTTVVDVLSHIPRSIRGAESRAV